MGRMVPARRAVPALGLAVAALALAVTATTRTPPPGATAEQAPLAFAAGPSASIVATEPTAAASTADPVPRPRVASARTGPRPTLPAVTSVPVTTAPPPTTTSPSSNPTPEPPTTTGSTAAPEATSSDPTALSDGRPDWVPSSAPLVFRDEFEAAALDGKHWTTCYPWAVAETGCTNHGNPERQWYLPGQVAVSGGALRLTAERVDTAGTDRAGLPVVFPYRSGMVTSAGRFSLTYGYVEFRARIPRGQAMWPALWLLPTDYSWPPEIDVMEAVGQVPTHVSLTLHGTDGTRPQKIVDGPDFSADWHTFGIDWGPTALTWYVDGVPRFTVDHGVPVKPMYLLANLAVGGGAGAVTAESPATASFVVDYVRVWRR